MEAVKNFNVHFVIFSRREHSYSAWAFRFDPNCIYFNEYSDAEKAEYGF
jgi:hypothetical protein